MAARDARPLASMRRRVTLRDTDAAGILYFATPYPWLEELFTGWMASIDHPVSELIKVGEQTCPCISSAASYLAPMRMDDHLELTLHPSHVGGTSFSVTAQIRDAGTARLAGLVTSWHVWVRQDPTAPETDRRPTRLPAWLRDALQSVPVTEPAGDRRAPV